MENRNTLVKQALAEIDSVVLNNEIDYFIEINAEEHNLSADYFDALEETHMLAEDLKDMKMAKLARRALILLGVYRVISDAELRNISVMGRHKKYDFILDGDKYIFVRDLPETA